jgi:pyruvate kinase
MHLDDDLKAALTKFKDNIYPKDIWIDLKCRELRLDKTTEISNNNKILEINHKLEVNTPTIMYFNEGNDFLQIDKVLNGNKLQLYLPDSIPEDFKVIFGAGASFNIPDPSLVVKDYLTDRDRTFIELGKSLDLHNYVLSFVEQKSDIVSLLELDSEANMLAKIESLNGLNFVKTDFEEFKDQVRLIAARGDLYIELERPHQILNALKTIIEVDETAIVASRLLQSTISHQKLPYCSDLCDMGFLLKLGYKAFLLGDYVCENEVALKSALGIMEVIYQEHLLNKF